jgi:putative copper export protein
MGTLLLVLLVTRGAPRVRHAALVELAPLAFGAVALVAGSGAYLAIRALPEVAALWQSRWGQLLVAKVLLVLGALALGARNHRALRASPATGSGLPWLRSVLGEALVGLAIVTVTAFLTSVSQPDHALDLEVAPVEAAPEDGTVHPEEDGHDH